MNVTTVEKISKSVQEISVMNVSIDKLSLQSDLYHSNNSHVENNL